MAVDTYGRPGPIHKGNGEMQSIIDERATPDQRRALTSVLQGEGAEPGKIMLQIYRAMCGKVHEPLFKPIEMTINVDGRTAQLRVPGVLETTVEPIKNSVTNLEHRARIDLLFGKEFNLAQVASGTTSRKAAVRLDSPRSTLISCTTP